MWVWRIGWPAAAARRSGGTAVRLTKGDAVARLVAASLRWVLMTPLGAAQADLDEVEAIVRAAGTSFYRGMRVLPPDRRHAMYAIYAFCRLVDDVADEAGRFRDQAAAA